MTTFTTIGHSPRAILLLTTAALLFSLTDGALAGSGSGDGGSGNAVNAGNHSVPVSKPAALSNPVYNPRPAAAPAASGPVARDHRPKEEKPASEPAEHDPLDR